MTDIRAAAINFEAVKLALSQSKDGVAFKLSIHPDDVKPELWTHPIGARYMVALVRLGDDDQPLSKPQPPAEGAAAPNKSKERWHDMKLSKRAAIMCGEPEFWQWIRSRFDMSPHEMPDATQAAGWLRHRTAVGSRAEYDINEAAGRRYLEIERAYYGDKTAEERYGR